MDTTKPDAEAHGRASGPAPASSDLRDTLTCVTELARLIVTVSDANADHKRKDVSARAARKVAVPVKSKVRWTPEQQSRFAEASAVATPLGALEATFDALCEIIPDVKEHSGATLAGVLPASMLGDKLVDIVHPIEEALIKIAWQTSQITCQSLEDVRIKAKILKVIVSDEPDDIESALTISMCDDILAQLSQRADSEASVLPLDKDETP